LIALDTNIFVYAHRRDSPWHQRARACVAGLAEGGAPWAIPWSCLHEFIALVTHPRIYAPPTPLAAAITQADAWQESPALSMLGESGEYWPVLQKLLRAGRVAGPVVHDARVAAICVDHGVSELWSADRDFGRFAGLKVPNPLAG